MTNNSILSVQSTHNSPLNNSTSKMQYSFPKQQRFQSQSQASLNPNLYDLPSTITKRAAGLGYGQKYDFTKLSKNVPGPNVYNSKTDFDLKGGISFGTSRENCKQGGFIKTDNKNPGPGSYSKPGTLSRVSYTIQARTKPFEPTNVKCPGPGTYPVLPAISDKGRYFNSKFKNSCATQIAPLNSKRFTSQDKFQVPGPGAYNTITSSQPGQYFVSSFKSSLAKSFSVATRQTFDVSKKTPGPGAYAAPSDFGVY